jgi:hypothetical protein
LTSVYPTLYVVNSEKQAEKKMSVSGGEKLRGWLKQHGRGAMFLSEMFYVHNPQVYNWLNGKTKPSLWNALRIERLTCGEVVPSDWLTAEETAQLDNMGGVL